MHLQNLSQTSIEEIVFAIMLSFEGYFVTMPSDNDYWAARFERARVDFSLSFGLFDNNELVGFIINGIDQYNGFKTAFNTGTGVLPKYRGQKIVDQLYQYALPYFKEANIQQCALEVIQQNDRAIRVYERIGFQTIKDYHCFKGKLPASNYQTQIQSIQHPDILLKPTFPHAWDNTNRAIQIAPAAYYESYKVSYQNTIIGYFTIHSSSGYLPQFIVLQPDKLQQWSLLFDGIAQIQRELKINNIDARRQHQIQALQTIGLENVINQFEMQYLLP